MEIPTASLIKMSQAQRFRLFFELHRDLPREGPGDFASTRRAFSMLTELPDKPQIIDFGCGPGMQTLHLSQLTNGNILAFDSHQPYLDQLSRGALEQGVADKIRVVSADMATLAFHRGAFDLIWAEGSAYCIGFENALRKWRPLLKGGGIWL